jgi:hypothetical protein
MPFVPYKKTYACTNTSSMKTFFQIMSHITMLCMLLFCFLSFTVCRTTTPKLASLPTRLQPHDLFLMLRAKTFWTYTCSACRATTPGLVQRLWFHYASVSTLFMLCVHAISHANHHNSCFFTNHHHITFSTHHVNLFHIKLIKHIIKHVSTKFHNHLQNTYNTSKIFLIIFQDIENKCKHIYSFKYNIGSTINHMEFLS